LTIYFSRCHFIAPAREAKEATEETSRRRSVKLPKIRKKNASKKALMEAMKLPKL
jgi:hypothetical protein